MPTSSPQELIKHANARLKVALTGVSIQQRGDRLYLRATLPPKPNASKPKSHQQEIALSIHANPAGIKHAEIKAKEVGVLLATQKFDWTIYLSPSSIPQSGDQPKTIGEVIQGFEIEYFSCNQRNPKTENNWKNNYRARFKYLPQEQPFTASALEKAIKTTPPDSCTRKGVCWVVERLAQFAGLDYSPKSLSGHYSSLKPAPRDLPSDELILEWFYRISDSDWRWAYAMLATYGLRPHELFHLDTKDLAEGDSSIKVTGGKTGFHQVWPYHPEWINEFQLRETKQLTNLLRSPQNKSNSRLGARAAYYIRTKEGLPFALYNLRHRWAVRTLEYGVDVSLAARQMGHSVMIHTKIYHAWIDEGVQERAFESALNNPNRPQAPKIILHAKAVQNAQLTIASSEILGTHYSSNFQQAKPELAILKDLKSSEQALILKSAIRNQKVIDDDPQQLSFL